MRVVIVEDSAALVALLTRRLTDAGHTVLLDGEPEDWARAQIDAVVLDVHLDGLPNGSRILERLRELLPEVPVIVTTGSDDARKRSQLDGPGVYWLDKPYEAGELVRLLGEVG